MNDVNDLIEKAMLARARAKPRRSGLSVGCALYSPEGVFIGANIETQWQTSYHAEEVAIINMAIGCDLAQFSAILVAAERELFSPCGACMDKILEFGGKDALIYHFRPSTKKVSQFRAGDLMPHYPTRS